MFLGLDQTSEAENFDRDNLLLPGAQTALALAVLVPDRGWVGRCGAVASAWTGRPGDATVGGRLCLPLGGS